MHIPVLKTFVPAALALVLGTVAVAMPATVIAGGATGTARARAGTVLEAKIVDGEVLIGGDIHDGVITVAYGDDLTVEIGDTETHFLYAVIIWPDGSDPEPWVRFAAGGSETGFTNVVSEIRSIVYAVEKKDPNKIKYGPVITVKPKG